jgi:mono/diheme cytochrome c family protein
MPTEQGGISEVPNPSPEMSQKSSVSLDKLQQGHAVYMLRCAECHQYPLPNQLAEVDFIDTIPEMVRHSGITKTEGDAVLAYILAVKKL